ncbi:sugar ABC transporter permease [Anaerocolumna sp. AGMB13020]|uniref:carbohydrate ABC transporter permease n=1 Tax=Anaerocolumna sp. AGMB13020 TaxID=3081750 RepID=UPI002952A964|nr:sugar ABC transporter permease [Anaerocolumna sp. AGMB13020]WOO38363.1 sugar ABC transporter permease [Anaerocolumna sp. AGMB13020]
MLYKKKLPMFLFLLPGLVLMVLFLYLPFGENIIDSLYELQFLVKIPGQELHFIGMANYQKLLADEHFRTALFNTIKLMAFTVIFQLGIALLLAIFVSSLKRGHNFFRTVYFFPIVISSTAIGLLFKLFYNFNGGMLNQLLEMLGHEPVNWLSPELAFTMISIPVIWSYVGFYFVIFLTGINEVPQELYDASKVDGCLGWQQVYYIILPLMKNVIGTCLVLAVTGALKVFDLPWAIAPKGAPQGKTHFLGTFLYEQTFTIGNVDYGSAIAFVIVLIGVLAAQTINRIFTRLSKEEDSL